MLGARDHVTQRADVRDRPPKTYSEPRGQLYGDVIGQYRDRHYPPEPVPREPYRGPTTAGYYADSTQDSAPPGLSPPWNKIPGF